jgi:ribitol-5-phosphate 2-dehydrogenase
MAICHADKRYYLGMRSPDVLRKKLPMAPVHEACGTVVADPTGTFNIGDRVVMIPNVSGDVSSGLFENYAPGSAFLSSGHDGFMREFVSLPPDRLVGCGDTIQCRPITVLLVWHRMPFAALSLGPQQTATGSYHR